MTEAKYFLSKIIPSRRHTIRAIWCRLDWILMSPTYRAIREKTSRPMCNCHWCKHRFADGEKMSLACFEPGGNQVLCSRCAGELLSSYSNEEPSDG